MRLLLKWFLVALAVVLGAYLLPGVAVEGFGTALLVALVLGILNAILRPILVVLTIPVTILTLGLFLLVINAAIILLADALIGGFNVDGFIWALIFSLLLSLLTWLIDQVLEKD